MIKYRGDREAFGKPGDEPHWTRGDKDGVGTAYSPAGYIWFTIQSGIITEIYCPTIDRAQVRSVKYLITDGKTFFHDEEHLITETKRLSDHALGYQISNFDPDGRYGIIKEVITNTRLPCILQRTQIRGNEDLLSELHLYVFLSPHLELGGWSNNAYVVEVAGKNLLVAEKKGAWLAMAANIPFSHLSCGYIGRSDGLTDIAENYQMDWEYDKALDGNVALIGRLPLAGQREFTLGVALGNSLHAAVTTLFQSLAIPFEEQKKQYLDQWETCCQVIMPLETFSKDKGNLYHSSYSLILGHEDKTYQGAFIASLSIPWGEAKGDEDLGGYHLVWTRDMVQIALGMLAAGNMDVPQRALI
jgi:glucoamylase